MIDNLILVNKTFYYYLIINSNRYINENNKFDISNKYNY